MDTQTLLVGGLILMAAINAASLIWASYLDHRLRGRPVPKHYEIHVEGTKIFSEMDMASVQATALGKLNQSADAAGQKLQQAMDAALDSIAGSVHEMTQKSLVQEFQKYQADLDQLRLRTVKDFAKIQQSLNKHHDETLGLFDAEIAKMREKRLEEFNQRLNDVISGYVVESLGNQADLEAQTAYIVQALEQHKDDIKRDVLS